MHPREYLEGVMDKVCLAIRDGDVGELCEAFTDLEAIEAASVAAGVMYSIIEREDKRRFAMMLGDALRQTKGEFT